MRTCMILWMILALAVIFAAVACGGGDGTINYKVTVDGTPVAVVATEAASAATAVAVQEECYAEWNRSIDEWNTLVENGIAPTVGFPDNFEVWAKAKGYPTEMPDC